jgi:hypothetical protein
MVTRLFAGIALVTVGAALVALGLLFLVAAKGELHRYLVAAGGLALGGALAGVGVRTFRRARASLPDALRADLLALARRRDGRVTEAELGAALGTRRAAARAEIEALCRAGTCRRESEGATTWYVFPELLPRLAVRRCRHCRTELPLDAALVSCPNCGGELRTGVETLARGDEELYSMDDER